MLFFERVSLIKSVKSMRHEGDKDTHTIRPIPSCASVVDVTPERHWSALREQVQERLEKSRVDMFHFATSELTHFLTVYGYWAVLLFVAIESMGIPFPGETMLLVAAIYAGTTHRLSLPLVILAAASGAILGDNLGYWIGRQGGYRLLRRYGHYLHLDECRVKLGQYLFRKYGDKVVFFGRFIAVLRAWAAFLAGTNRMSWKPFLFFNALGGIIWATLYGLGGYFLGDNIHRLAGPVGSITVVLGLLITIASLVFVHRNEQRLEKEAEHALPGPLDTSQPVS
jgi:membrane protein DedA with SNARE-associated domain